MARSNRKHSMVGALLWLFVVPLLVVGLKYWYWERTRHTDEAGYQVPMPWGGAVYTNVFEAAYLPAKAVVNPLVRRLPLGGIAIDFAADLVAVMLQHAGLLLLWRTWQLRRRRTESRPTASRGET